jgi:hypothetical protein
MTFNPHQPTQTVQYPYQPQQPYAPALVHPPQQPAQPGQYPYQPQQPVFAPQQRGFGAPQQAPNAAAIFANIGAASASKQSNWIRPGDYLFRIEAMKLICSRKRENILVAELTCVHVFSGAFAQQLGMAPHVPGETLAASYNDKHDGFLGNVKAMIAGIEGVPGEQIDAIFAREGTSLTQHCVLMTSEAQPYAGMFVHVTAQQIVTKRGTPFTRINWLREVKPSELSGILFPDELQRFFPGDALQQLIASEQRIQAAGGSPAQPQAPAAYQQYVPPAQPPGAPPRGSPHWPGDRAGSPPAPAGPMMPPSGFVPSSPSGYQPR